MLKENCKHTKPPCSLTCLQLYMVWKITVRMAVVLFVANMAKCREVKDRGSRVSLAKDSPNMVSDHLCRRCVTHTFYHLWCIIVDCFNSSTLIFNFIRLNDLLYY